MKILLTGSTGLLGSHLLEQGLAKGHHFILPVRSINKKSFLGKLEENHPQVETFQVEDEWPKEAFSNLDIIINCAGLASSKEEDFEAMKTVNIELPKKLYEQKGKAKFVQISSIATLASGQVDYIVSEEKPGKTRDTFYAQSKLEIDKWLESKNDPELLTIHPCYMLGKYDVRPSSGAIFLALKFKKMPEYIDNMKNFVAASDVATGIYQAIENDCHGNFILGGENIKIKHFLGQALSQLVMDNELNEVEDSQNPFVTEFCSSSEVSWAKAQDSFGYQPVMNTQMMIKEALDYFQEMKMIRIKIKRPKRETE